MCLLEHCDGYHKVLEGRIGAIARDALEDVRENVESTLKMSGLGLDHCLELDSPPAGDDDRLLEPPPLGVRRQLSFRPASMLTDEEQQNVRSRRRNCVLRLAREAMGLTASKISKCRGRWHDRQVEADESARPGA